MTPEDKKNWKSTAVLFVSLGAFFVALFLFLAAYNNNLPFTKGHEDNLRILEENLKIEVHQKSLKRAEDFRSRIVYLEVPSTTDDLPSTCFALICQTASGVHDQWYSLGPVSCEAHKSEIEKGLFDCN